MDPLSITVSVSSLIVVCTRIIKLSSDVSKTYRSASFVLSAIASECAVISASLTRLQNMLLSRPDRLGALAESLDTALLGCALTMSVLQEQIGGLANETENGELKPKKFKYVLEQDYLKELLQQIRGQQASITLLLQTYQSESLTKLEQSMQDYNIVLQRMVDKGLSLWRGVHSLGQDHVPTLVVGNNETDSVFELSSIITDTRFDFDDEVINSKAYRRALVNLKQAQSDTGRLDNDETQPGQTLHNLQEVDSDQLGDDETAASEMDLLSTSLGYFDFVLPDDEPRDVGTSSLPARFDLDDSTSTPFKEEETEGSIAKVVSDLPVRRQPVPVMKQSADPDVPRPHEGIYHNIDRPSELHRGSHRAFESLHRTTVTSRMHICPQVLDEAGIQWDWDSYDHYFIRMASASPDKMRELRERTVRYFKITPSLNPPLLGPLMTYTRENDTDLAARQSGLDHKHSYGRSPPALRLTIPPEHSFEREKSQTVDDQSLGQPEPITASTVPEVAIFEWPFLVPLRASVAEGPQPSAPEVDIVKRQSEDDPKDDSPTSKSMLPLPPQSSPAESPSLGKGAVATSPPKIPSSRFQRFVSTFLPPSSTQTMRKLVIVGDRCTGKSALLIRFSKGFMPDRIPATVFENYVADVEVDGKHVELALWDTSGDEAYDRMRPLSYQDAHVVLIVFSVANKDSWDNVQEKWIPEVLHFCKGVPIILVGTEKDRRDSNDLIPGWRDVDPVTSEEGEALRKKIGALRYVECSAVSTEGVSEVFEHAAGAALRTRVKKQKQR